MRAMNKQDIAHGVSDLIADVLQLRNSEQSLDGHRNEISEWDSLGHLRIFMAIENKYDVKVPLEDIFSVNSRDDIVEILSKALLRRDKDI